jgi:hypothetical protein
MVTPLPAEALVRRALIEDGGVAEPMVVPEGIRARSVDGGGVGIDDGAPACIGDELGIERTRRGAASKYEEREEERECAHKETIWDKGMEVAKWQSDEVAECGVLG